MSLPSSPAELKSFLTTWGTIGGLILGAVMAFGLAYKTCTDPPNMVPPETPSSVPASSSG